MKLIVMIPCYNEEETLPLVLKDIPKKIPGIDSIESLVIDDGSTDKTVQVAKNFKANHIISHIENKGLATAFATGLDTALNLGADIIVNTDGDNQYPQKEIPRLIKPVVEGKADIVVGDRQTKKISHFSYAKKLFQALGSWIVRIASGTKIPDAVSGFRAFSKEAAMRLNVITTFSYTTETIIQAGKRQIAITHIPIKTQPKLRKSRLFKSMWSYLFETAKTITRVYSMYEAFRIFTLIGGGLAALGVLGILRFAYFYLAVPKEASGHIQSLIVSAVFLIIGFQIILMGILADLTSINRKLIEEALYRLKKLSLKKRNS